MNILLVEDSPADREVLRYLLTEQFQGKAKFFEADRLDEAISILETSNISCVVLDLQLPDSIGRETFTRIYARFPDIPVIVMTNSKDRELALEMIQIGAADFVIKSYGDEEDIFRRILFAIEKHRRSIRIPIEDAHSYHRLERAKVNLEESHTRDESPSTIRNMTVETTAAIADLSQRMYTELQNVSLQLSKQAIQQETIAQTVGLLDKEVLRGHSQRPSMRSKLDLMEHRIQDLEEDVKAGKTAAHASDTESKQITAQITQTKLGNRTKIIIAIITLIGTAVTTYIGTTYANKVTQSQGNSK